MRAGRLTLPGQVEVHDITGDTVTVAGVVDAQNLDHLLALRQAAAGMVDNPDEPVVPVVVPGGWRGFARTAEVSLAPLSGRDGIGRYAFSFERVSNEAAPLVTVGLLGHPQDPGPASPVYAHCVPAGYDLHSWVPGEAGSNQTRATADGFAVGGVRYRRLGGAGVGATTARYAVAPEFWWRGACHVEALAGGEWVQVVGRRSLPEGPWRVSNGLVRASLTATGLIRVEWWRADGGGWTTAREFAVDVFAEQVPRWGSVEVVSLSAREVVIRAQAYRPQGRTTLTMTIKRGLRHIWCSLDTESHGSGIDYGYALRPQPPTSVTYDETNQHVWTTGANGLGWMMASSMARSSGGDLTTGRFAPFSLAIAFRRWSFGIAGWFTGTGASGDTASRDATFRLYYGSQSQSEVIR